MALNQARNNRELEQMLIGNTNKPFGRGIVSKLSPPLVAALDYVLQQIAQRNEELIMRIIYNNYTPEVYDRTDEFRQAWDYSLSSSGNQVLGTFGYTETSSDAGRIMKYRPEYGQHGTPDSFGQTIMNAWGDAREYLAEIIYEGQSSDVFGHGPWTRKRDVWKPLIDSINSKAMSTWFERGMIYAGLKYRKK